MYEFTKFPERRNTGCIKWDIVPEGTIPMWVADMDFPIAPQITEAIEKRVSHPIYGYADSEQKTLRAHIIKHYIDKYDVEVKDEWIVWVPSVISGMVASLQMLGKSFIYSVPMYNHIRMLEKETKLPAIEVPMKRDENYYFTMDIEALENQINEEVGAMILCNPHNPVGRMFSREELLEIQEFNSKHHLIMISDEIHCELAFDKKHIPYFAVSEEAAQNSITLCSAGKICNIPGLPMGFAIIPNASLREQLNKKQEGLLSAVNVLTQAAYEAAYDGSCDEWKDELRDQLKKNRDYLEERISKIEELKMTHNEGTYLSWIDCSALGLENPYQYFYKEAKVMFSPGEVFGDKQCIRVNFGCPHEQLKEALDRMENAILKRRK